MRTILLFSIAVNLLLFSCKCKKDVAQSNKTVNTVEATKEPEKSSKENEKNTGKMGIAIANKYWKAVEIMGEKVIMPEGMSQEPYFKLTNKGEVKGNGGCNSFFGNYELGKNNFIKFGELGMTEMECAFKSYDMKMAEVLQMTQQYILVGEDKLQLVVGKRAPLAKFEAVYFE